MPLIQRSAVDIGIRERVQVNAINPGRVRSGRLQTILEAEAAQHGGDIQTAEEEMARKANVVRLGEPGDVANLAAFILSPQPRLLQGSLIDLDGGRTKTVQEMIELRVADYFPEVL